MPQYNTITFENNKIIIISDNNNVIWFHGRQICDALKYKDIKQALRNNIDKEDKIQLKNMDINNKKPNFQLTEKDDNGKILFNEDFYLIREYIA